MSSSLTDQSSCLTGQLFLGHNLLARPVENYGLLRAARKLTVRVLPWHVRVLVLVPLQAAYRLRARAGSNHYFLVRPDFDVLFCFLFPFQN